MPKAISLKVMNRMRMIEDMLTINDSEEYTTNFQSLSNLLGIKVSAVREWLKTGVRLGYLTVNSQGRGEDRIIALKINWDVVNNYKPEPKPNIKKTTKTASLEVKNTVEVKPESETFNVITPIELEKCTSEKRIESSDLTAFNSDFGKIRGVLINEEPWFIGKDIANILGYRDAFNVKRIVDEEDSQVIFIKHEDKSYKATIINESGLYAAIFKSTKPEAKRFKRWVTSVVLPSIRKTGGYAKDAQGALEVLLSDTDGIVKLLEALKKEKEQFKLLSNKLEDSSEYIEYGKAAEKTNGSNTIEEWAKNLSKEEDVVIGRNKAYRWLRNKGFVNKKNVPYQRAIESGYLESKIRFIRKDDRVMEVLTTYITPKGQLKLSKKILRDFGDKQKNVLFK